MRNLTPGLLADVPGVAMLALLVAACGSASSSQQSIPACDPAATQGGAPIRYRLVTADHEPFERGSTIAFRDAHVMREFPQPEPLSGTLDFIAESPLPEGSRVALRLVGYDLHGAGQDLAASGLFLLGPTGTFRASVTAPGAVAYDLRLEPYQLSGTAPATVLDDACPPSFDGLDMLGQSSTSMLSMKIRLVAAPE